MDIYDYIYKSYSGKAGFNKDLDVFEEPFSYSNRIFSKNILLDKLPESPPHLVIGGKLAPPPLHNYITSEGNFTDVSILDGGSGVLQHILREPVHSVNHDALEHVFTSDHLNLACPEFGIIIESSMGIVDPTSYRILSGYLVFSKGANPPTKASFYSYSGRMGCDGIPFMHNLTPIPDTVLVLRSVNGVTHIEQEKLNIDFVLNDTDELREGSNNLFFTKERAIGTIMPLVCDKIKDYSSDMQKSINNYIKDTILTVTDPIESNISVTRYLIDENKDLYYNLQNDISDLNGKLDNKLDRRLYVEFENKCNTKLNYIIDKNNIVVDELSVSKSILHTLELNVEDLNLTTRSISVISQAIVESEDKLSSQILSLGADLASTTSIAHGKVDELRESIDSSLENIRKCTIRDGIEFNLISIEALKNSENESKIHKEMVDGLGVSISKEVESLRVALKSSSIEAEKIGDIVDTNCGKIKEMSEKMPLLTQDLSRVSYEVDRANSEINEINKNIVKTSSDITEINGRVNSIEHATTQSISELDLCIQNVKSDIVIEKEYIENALHTTNNSVSDAIVRVDIVTKKCDDLRGKIDNVIEDNTTSLKKYVTDYVSERIYDVSSDISATQAGYEELMTELTKSFDSNSLSINNRITTLAEKLSVSNFVVGGFEQDLVSVSNYISAMNDKIIDTNESLVGVGENITQLSQMFVSDVSELDSRLSARISDEVTQLYGAFSSSMLSVSTKLELDRNNSISSIESNIKSINHTISSLTTDSIPEGKKNKFMNIEYINSLIPTKDHFNEYISSYVPTICTADIRESGNLYFTEDRVKTVMSTTDDLPEGSQLYFTDERAERVAARVATNLKLELDADIEAISQKKVTSKEIYEILNIEENSIITEIPDNFVTNDAFSDKFSTHFFDHMNNISTLNIREDPQRKFFSETAFKEYIQNLTTTSIREEGDMKYFNLNSFLNENISTDHVIEGSINLYYTDQKVDNRINNKLSSITTDNITEGSDNLFFDELKVRNIIATVNEETNSPFKNYILSLESSIRDLSLSVATLDSSSISEHSNLYFTVERAINATREPIQQASKDTLELVSSLINTLELKISNDISQLRKNDESNDVSHLVDNINIIESTITPLSRNVSILDESVTVLSNRIDAISLDHMDVVALEKTVRSIGGELIPQITNDEVMKKAQVLQSELRSSLSSELSQNIVTNIKSELTNRLISIKPEIKSDIVSDVSVLVQSTIDDMALSIGKSTEDALNYGMNNVEERISDKVKDVESSIIEVTTSIGGYMDTMSLSVDTRINSVSTSISKVSDDLLILSGELTNISTVASGLSHNLSIVSSNVTESSARVDGITARVDGITTAANEVSARMDEVTTTANEVSGRVDEVIISVNEVSARVDEVASIVDNSSKSLLADIESTKTYAKEGLDTLDNKFIDITTTLTTESIKEENNLYFTPERALNAVSEKFVEFSNALKSTNDNIEAKLPSTLDDIHDGEIRKLISEEHVFQLISTTLEEVRQEITYLKESSDTHDSDIYSKIESIGSKIYDKEHLVEHVLNSITTSDIKEGSNLFFTNSRILEILNDWKVVFVEYLKDTLTTDDITEGKEKLYFNKDRVSSSDITLDNVFDGHIRKIPTDTSEIKESTSALYYTNQRVLNVITPINTELKRELEHKLDTTFIAEGSQLFYKDSRVDSRIQNITSHKFDDIENTIGGIRGMIDSNITSLNELTSHMQSITTDSVAEGGSNLYYTDERFSSSFWKNMNHISTLNIREDPQRRYLSVESVKSIIQNLDTSHLPGSTQNRYLTEQNLRDLNISSDSIVEGSKNIYYNDVYVDKRVKDMRHSIDDLYNNISKIKSDASIPPKSVTNLDVTVNTRNGSYIYNVKFDHPMGCTFCISFDDIIRGLS